MIGLLRPAEYYREAAPTYQLGQVCLAPSQFLWNPQGPHNFVLRSHYNQSQSGYEYRVDKVIRLEDLVVREDLNKDLGTRYQEVRLVVPAKRRPVIVISREFPARRDGKRSSEESLLVVPVYSFEGRGKREPHTDEYIARVKAYYFWEQFYMPESTQVGISEGYARLDRIHPVAANAEWIKPLKYALSDDAFKALRSWIRVYMGEELHKVDDLLFDYREDRIKSLMA